MTSATTKDLNVAVIVKLEPDFSEGNVSYNAEVHSIEQKQRVSLDLIVL